MPRLRYAGFSALTAAPFKLLRVKNLEVAMGKLLHEALSYELVGALFEVHKVLGPGLLESAYEGHWLLSCRTGV
jgi:hypothetical protein